MLDNVVHLQTIGFCFFMQIRFYPTGPCSSYITWRQRQPVKPEDLCINSLATIGGSDSFRGSTTSDVSDHE